ncbi:MAG: PIN domain-containing protein [Oscillospiraceae bacterium]|jgi:predicted nucleic acid-binding protein|nr:PIN domain-containing protein [Oscillospiraceae bacterium]
MRQIIILDANAILRYIIDDIPEQADIVETALQNEEVLLLPEVVAEVVYVLSKYYNLPHAKVSEHLERFFVDAGCDSDTLVNAVKTFGSKNLDFVDCVLYEYSKQQNYIILTFDDKLKRLIKA